MPRANAEEHFSLNNREVKQKTLYDAPVAETKSWRFGLLGRF